MTEQHRETSRILDLLVQLFPRHDLKPTQVFALDDAKAHLAELRSQLNSPVPLGDGQGG